MRSALDQFHDAVDVEDRHRQHRRTAEERRDQPGLAAEGVEVRVDHQVAVALAQIGERRPLLVHPQRLLVVHHHALGPAGGARGVDDVGDVVAGSHPPVALERRSAGEEVRLQVDRRHVPRARRSPGPRKPCWTSTALAPLRAMTSAASSALNRVLTGTSTPPAVIRPNAAMIHSRGVRRPDRDAVALVDAELGEGACGTYECGRRVRRRTVATDRRRPLRRRRSGPPRSRPSRGWSAKVARCGHVVTRRPRLPPMIFA